MSQSHAFLLIYSWSNAQVNRGIHASPSEAKYTYEHGDVFFLRCPPIVQSSGRFKTAHIDVYYSARAEPEVRQFETALYEALF
jgi:hypothetical protein